MNSILRNCRAVVVDDELLPRTHLTHLLRESGVGSVLQAESAVDCLRLIEFEEDTPDMVFLDIQMPGMDGLSLADALTANRAGSSTPSIVFVTGYEDYAIQAFERAALDYLVKPVDRGRLEQTLNRIASSAAAIGSTKLTGKTPLPVPALQRLPIKLDYAVRLVDVDEIIAAGASQKRVEVITPDTVYSTYYTLNQLEQRLPGDRFLRVHESWIINLSQVHEIHNLGSQSYQLKLKSDSRMIPVSRRRLPALQSSLGI